MEIQFLQTICGLILLEVSAAQPRIPLILGQRTGGSQSKRAGERLELSCAGDNADITWRLPNNSKYLDWSDPAKDGRLRLTPARPVGGGKFETVLVIERLQSADTGGYVCNGSGSLEQNEVYIFVQDGVPEHVFLHWSEQRNYGHLISIFEDKESRIDCLATHPDVSAQLQVGGRTLPQFSASYDPRKGFLVPPNSLIGYSKGIMGECSATTPSGLRDTLRFLLITVTRESSKVELNSSLATHAYRGGKLELICSAQPQSGSSAVGIHCTWTFPALQEYKHDPNTKRITETLERKSEAVITVLTVSDLRLNDSGTYKCSCTIWGDDRSESALVSVSPTKGQIRKIQVQSKQRQVAEGDSVKFSASFEIWPEKSEETWSHEYLLPIFGKMQNKVEGGTTETSATSKDGFVAKTTEMRLSEVNVKDSGNYILEIKAEDNVKTVIFVLTVISKTPGAHVAVVLSSDPQKELDRRFLDKDLSYDILCTGIGYPLPNVSLQWKACRQQDHCSWNDVHDPIVRVGTYQKVLIIRKSFLVKATYSCTSGFRTNLQLETIETDIPNAQENRGMILKAKHQRAGEDGDPYVIYEKEGIRLQCGVQKYSYQDLEWVMMESDNKTGLVIGDRHGGREGYVVEFQNSSLYSNWLELVFDYLQVGNTGVYQCRARLDSETLFSQRNYVLNVIGVEKPTFHNSTSPKTLFANYSMPLTLHCGANAVPDAKLQWLKSNKPLIPRPGVSISPDRTTVNISRVVREDAGVYSCLASNRAGKIMRNLTVKIVDLPAVAVLSNTEIIVLGACLAVAVLFVLALLTVVCVMKRKEMLRTAQLKELYDQLMEYAHGGEGTIQLPRKLDPTRPLNNQAENLPYDRRYELSKDDLELGPQLGQGQFGLVHRGVLTQAAPERKTPKRRMIPVAVKMPKNGKNLQHQKALLDELKIMIYIGNHVNVLSLVGAITKHMVKGELYMVMELCELGSLLDYLRSNRPTFISEIVNDSPLPQEQASDGYLLPNQMADIIRSRTRYQGECDHRWSTELERNRKSRSFLSTADLLSYSCQAANGMDFLAQKNLIHRDLAARNLLLTEKEYVKIADFGLARQDEVYHVNGSRNVPLPVKWLALESIIDHEYTVKSDIWSFGVVLWEMFSLGESPYPAQPLDPSFVTFLREGNRLDSPPHAPREIYQLMQRCWLLNPQDRPSFSHCLQVIGCELRRCSPYLFESLSEFTEWGEENILEQDEEPEADRYRPAAAVSALRSTDSPGPFTNQNYMLQDYLPKHSNYLQPDSLSRDV